MRIRTYTRKHMILSTSEYLFSSTADKIGTLVTKRTWSTTSLLHKRPEVNFNLEVNSLDNHSKVFSTLVLIDYMKLLSLFRFHGVFDNSLIQRV
jgi:hypothetical protein